jgi:hypothetical protein
MQLAFEGHHEAVALLEKLGTNPIHSAIGYAIAGNSEYVNRYSGCIADRYQFDCYACEGYARGGHTAQVERYWDTSRMTYHPIVTGYALGGHFSRVEYHHTTPGG